MHKWQWCRKTPACISLQEIAEIWLLLFLLAHLFRNFRNGRPFGIIIPILCSLRRVVQNSEPTQNAVDRGHIRSFTGQISAANMDALVPHNCSITYIRTATPKSLSLLGQSQLTVHSCLLDLKSQHWKRRIPGRLRSNTRIFASSF